MARQEFIDNMRAARNLFAHSKRLVEGLEIDPQTLENRIARAAIWLMPKSVRGFDANDFPKLAPERQHELSEAVREFLAAANEVPVKDLPTPDQIARGSAAFEKIIEILDPYLSMHPEAQRIQEALETVEFPYPVANWDYKIGENHVGDPAVWVTIFVDERVNPARKLGRFPLELTHEIRHAFSDFKIDRLPYIRMGGVFEQMALR